MDFVTYLSTLGLKAEDTDGVRVLLRPFCTLMAFDWPAPAVINSAAAAPRVLRMRENDA